MLRQSKETVDCLSAWAVSQHALGGFWTRRRARKSNCIEIVVRPAMRNSEKSMLRLLLLRMNHCPRLSRRFIKQSKQIGHDSVWYGLVVGVVTSLVLLLIVLSPELIR